MALGVAVREIAVRVIAIRGNSIFFIHLTAWIPRPLGRGGNAAPFFVNLFGFTQFDPIF